MCLIGRATTNLTADRYMSTNSSLMVGKSCLPFCQSFRRCWAFLDLGSSFSWRSNQDGTDHGHLVRYILLPSYFRFLDASNPDKLTWISPRFAFRIDHGLLVAMSLFDILGSLTSATGPFLYPKETSDRIWAMGTSGTCTAIGFFNQFGSHTAMLYNGILSIYFLLTARFNIPNSEIASRFEAAMHYMCIGYPLITAFVGLFLNVYGERSTTIGCWVSRCRIEYFTGEAVCEERGLIEGFFGRYPVVAALAMLICGNLLIWIHLRQQMDKRRKRKIAAGVDVNGDSDDESSTEDEYDSSRTEGNTRSKDTFTAGQRRALRLVSSQAFLFVGSFMLCNTVTFVLRHIIPPNLKGDPKQNYVAEMEIPYNNFTLMVIQAVLFPLQGLLNMMIYIRPKVSKWMINIVYLSFMATYNNCRLFSTRTIDCTTVRRRGYGQYVGPFLVTPLHQPLATTTSIATRLLQSCP